MESLVHRIRVFVYRLGERTPEYLLLRSEGFESFWGPLHGAIGFGEKLESAIRREVMDDTGLGRPLELLDLQMPKRWVLGDEQVIEWNYGFRAEEDDVRLKRPWAAFRWDEFPAAYPSLELESDRAAIMRLHTMLSSN